MHGTYLFLLSDIQDGDTALDQATAKFTELYAERFCDENNWWSVLEVAVEDGGSYAASSDKPRRRPPLSFEAAWKLAAQVAYTELGTYMELGINPFSFGQRGQEEERIDQLEPTQLIDEGLARACQELADRYRQLSGAAVLTGAPSSGPLNLDMEDWRRRRLAEVVEAIRCGPHRPFADEMCSPYQYRCFDLTGGESDAPFAILLVDIHT